MGDKKKNSGWDTFKAVMSQAFETPGSMAAKAKPGHKTSKKVKQFREGLGLKNNKKKKY